MRASVRAAFGAHVEHWEGRVEWMYLDTRGLVTTGIGNLIDQLHLALELPWLRADGTEATEAEVTEEWERVKSATDLASKGARVARYVTSLRLSAEAIDGLVAQKREEFWRVLELFFADIEEWPAPAQLGVLLMAWALGPHAWRKWPKFTAACELRDWTAAAEECEIRGARPARNQAHVELFLAAAVAVDPDALPAAP